MKGYRWIYGNSQIHKIQFFPFSLFPFPLSQTKRKCISGIRATLYWSAWLVAIALSGIVEIPAQGIEAPDGTVAFESGLLLKDAHTTFDGVRVKQARYYFDLELPADLGESLQKVVFQQRSGGDEITFKPEETEVYLGNHHDKAERVEAIATRNEDTGKITVQFEQPIAPGNQVTISLKPKSNPSYGGVYLFGVTAYPTGEKARGMYLGAGRLHFENYNDSDLF